MSPAERYAVVPDETVSLYFVNSTKLYPILKLQGKQMGQFYQLRTIFY